MQVIQNEMKFNNYYILSNLIIIIIHELKFCGEKKKKIVQKFN